jgi:hypothetical protein
MLAACAAHGLAALGGVRVAHTLNVHKMQDMLCPALNSSLWVCSGAVLACYLPCAVVVPCRLRRGTARINVFKHALAAPMLCCAPDIR